MRLISGIKKSPSQGMGKDYTQQFVTNSDEEETLLTNSRLKTNACIQVRDSAVFSH